MSWLSPSGLVIHAAAAAAGSADAVEAQFDAVGVARARADEQAFVHPAQAPRRGFKARVAAEVDPGGVDGFAAHQASDIVGVPRADAGVLDIDAFAVGRFDDVARVNVRVGSRTDHLEIRAARQDLAAQARAVHRTARDGNDAAAALRGVAHFLRRADLDDDGGHVL
ncbi:hypothetical protein G6F22_011516 [Rhizopus arrhizus]|nr:hypothetical protein G6F22_011516 [Rhizopus arrhizus]